MKWPPWQAASESTKDAAQPEQSTPDSSTLGAREMSDARRTLAREAGVALVRYLSAPGVDDRSRSEHLRSVLREFDLSAEDFRYHGPNARTDESVLFAAAERAANANQLGVAGLSRALTGLRDEDRAGYGFQHDDTDAYVREMQRDHRFQFGERIRTKDPADFLELRLVAYARLLEAQQIMATSRLGAHTDVDLRWAERVDQAQRKVSDARVARDGSHDRLVDAIDKFPIGVPAAATAIPSAITLAMGLTGNGEDAVPVGVAAMGGALVFAAVEASRIPIAVATQRAKSGGREGHRQLDRALNARPSQRR